MKDVQSTGKPSSHKIQHYRTRHFFTTSFVVGHFCSSGPDPADKINADPSGSGSITLNSKVPSLLASSELPPPQPPHTNGRSYTYKKRLRERGIGGSHYRCASRRE